MNNLPLIAVYNGRFHPMGQHHYQTYKKITEIFGYENTFITTADDVRLPKSPLNFAEKEKIAAAHGINIDKMVFTVSGYQPKELHEKIMKERGLTADDYTIVFIVGAKDMEVDPRFKNLGGMTKPTKTNPVPRPRYMKKFDPNDLQPASQHGYIYTIPTYDFILPNGEKSSGTKLRQFLADATPEEFQAAMGFFDQEIYDMLQFKFAPENLYPGLLNELRDRSKLVKGTQEYSDYLDEVMTELQFIKNSYDSRKKIGARYRKEAAKIQDAYSEVRRLKRQNEKILNSLNESFDRDALRSYFGIVKR